MPSSQRGRFEVHSEAVKQKIAARSGGPPSKPGEPSPEIPEWIEKLRISVEHEAPLLRTLLMRGINAVLRFATLSEKAVANATQAPTDLDVLVRALSSPELLEELTQANPLAPAFIRGVNASRRLIIEHGGAFTVTQAATHMGITRQAVDKRRNAGKLLAISTGRHGFRYPAWQFDDSGVLPGLEDVLNVLGDHDAWLQVAFFVSKNERLGGKTP